MDVGTGQDQRKGSGFERGTNVILKGETKVIHNAEKVVRNEVRKMVLKEGTVTIINGGSEVVLDEVLQWSQMKYKTALIQGKYGEVGLFPFLRVTGHEKYRSYLTCRDKPAATDRP
jgi:hypothetical protein